VNYWALVIGSGAVASFVTMLGQPLVERLRRKTERVSRLEDYRRAAYEEMVGLISLELQWMRTVYPIATVGPGRDPEPPTVTDQELAHAEGALKLYGAKATSEALDEWKDARSKWMLERHLLEGAIAARDAQRMLRTEDTPETHRFQLYERLQDCYAAADKFTEHAREMMKVKAGKRRRG
jgi:hypothetical protein